MKWLLGFFALAHPYEARIAELLLKNAELRAEILQHKATISDRDAKISAMLANAEKEGPKRDLEKANDAQAARAMARNTKQAFQAYQEGVKIILARLDKLKGKNRITANDMAELDLIRRELRGKLRREL